MLVIIQSKIFCLPVLYKNLKIKIYKTVTLQVVLYGCETWSLTLRDKRVLRRKFEPKRKMDNGENCIMMNFTACILHRNIVRVIKSRRMRWADMWHAWGRGEVFI
jgi:hypothetical protein